MKKLTEMLQVIGDENISLSPHFVSGNKVKAGSHITMGADELTLLKIMTGELVPFLMVLKKEDVEKMKSM